MEANRGCVERMVGLFLLGKSRERDVGMEFSNGRLWDGGNAQRAMSPKDLGERTTSRMMNNREREREILSENATHARSGALT